MLLPSSSGFSNCIFAILLNLKSLRSLLESKNGSLENDTIENGVFGFCRIALLLANIVINRMK